MNKNLYFLLLLFVFNSISATAQVRHYDIELFGDVIGEIITQKKNISDTEYELSYRSKAEATVFFISTKTDVRAKILFKDNYVNTGYILRKKNDESQEIHCKWNGSDYTIINNDVKSIETQKIYYCSTNFFFQEPVNIKKVYIERLGVFEEIEHLGNHQYLTKVDGGTNLYTYKNGVLQSLKSKKGISIYMTLKEKGS